MLLDKKFRSELERRYVEEKRPFPADGIIPFPPSNRFHTLIYQRHVQVLLLISPIFFAETSKQPTMYKQSFKKFILTY